MKQVEEALKKLVAGNKNYVDSGSNTGVISKERRLETSKNGQSPYAVVITCSDSRVPPEHIFSAGIGDLFVIRTAGNVIGDFELGSIEYGVAHLGAKVILVLGHTHCGAVAAAMSGHGAGYIQKILDEIVPVIKEETDVCECENLNIANSVSKIKESKAIMEKIEKGEVALVSGKYNIETGLVSLNEK
ncbi:MAG: carbonic anhydrase [Eubacteriaceae bacterium]